MHGDIAVSSKGEVYVSVQDPAARLQVYAPDGAFLRNLTGAPSDFHGFVIRTQPDGEFLYGASLRGQTIVKMTLDGDDRDDDRLVGGSRRVQGAQRAQQPAGAAAHQRLDVAANGDLYVTDGYASDYIHRFDQHRQATSPRSAARQAPYSFNTLHKLAIDTRFQPARIIATDRANNRVVHLSLDGRVPRCRGEGSAAAGRRSS